jgi:hypothetical protein
VNDALNALCDELMAMFPPFLPSHPAIDKELRDGIRKRVQAWARRWVEGLRVESELDQHYLLWSHDPAGLRKLHAEQSMRHLFDELVKDGRERGVMRVDDLGRDGNAYRTRMGLALLRTAPK